VTGGIAAYKVVHVARDLTQYGATVDVVLTRSAESFVGSVTFEGVTGRRVHTDIVAPGAALDHIRLAREADVICVAPATADFMARIATGRADDLLAAILLATRAPVLLGPAMNDVMWAHPQTQRNAAHLRDVIGYRLIGPAIGPLAFGEGSGPGRMEEPDVIVQHIGRALEADTPLRGRKVVVTAGPTREALDPVRVLTNRSSGRMGFALAASAWRRGADVVLIHGPTAVALPRGPTAIAVESASEMEAAVRAQLHDAAVLIMAAAVADFRPAAQAEGKMKKSHRPEAIALEDAPDVLLATRNARPADLVVVGFALETGDGREQAARKLSEKGLDIIVLNNADEPGAGFETETNRVLLLDRLGVTETVPLLPKTEIAEIILDRVAPLVARAR
jgi:phosphopantothenoylcysteine decarboxylase/phosphopantothenate--cysteine ligase